MIDVDVAIAGDGPAGMALASACRRHGLAVVVVGRGRSWGATYGTWRDDVADLGDELFVSVMPRIAAWGDRRHVLERTYAIVDNERLRAELARDVQSRRGRATGVQHFAWGSRLLTDGGDVDARLVVDATGWPPMVAGASQVRRAPAWQTAYGVVLDSLPHHLDGPTLMDLRASGAADAIPSPSFAYVVPSGDRWLVEETVLAARPSVAPDLLAARLGRRIGHDVTAADERVRIPMGVAAPRSVPPVVAFGAAAGYVHPATGYSLAPSLRAAPRVAAAVHDAVERGHTGSRLMSDTWRAVWPAPMRRTRALHLVGLHALLGLDGDGTRSFFDAFFDLPVERWRDYLRVDAPPGAVARTMRDVFTAVPGRVRRRLVSAVPGSLLERHRSAERPPSRAVRPPW